MKVLYDHQVFSLQDSGGISRYHWELASHLSAYPMFVPHFFLGMHSTRLELSRLGNARVSQVPNLIHVGPSKMRYGLNELIGTIWAARIGDKFDVYHPTLYRKMNCVRARKIVVTHHDCVQERFPSLFSNVSRLRRMKQKLFRDADVIISVSNSSKNDLLTFYDIDASKVHVVHHGVSKLQARTPRKHSKPYLLYVGARYTYKNFIPLLSAFARSRVANDFDLLAVGGGALSAREQAIIKELGMEGKVVVTPYCNNEELASCYRGAHLLAYVSLYEGFGFPPLEAMSLGCPVLVSDSSSLPEVCGKAAFYCDAREEDSIMNSLLTACYDESKRSENRELGATLSAMFTWDACAAKTLSLYLQ